jgi:hypothetical protein
VFSGTPAGFAQVITGVAFSTLIMTDLLVAL